MGGALSTRNSADALDTTLVVYLHIRSRPYGQGRNLGHRRVNTLLLAQRSKGPDKQSLGSENLVEELRFSEADPASAQMSSERE